MPLKWRSLMAVFGDIRMLTRRNAGGEDEVPALMSVAILRVGAQINWGACAASSHGVYPS